MGSMAFDFVLGSNKLYNPVVGDTFKIPNGLSMRPMGTNLAEYAGSFRGKWIF